MASKKLTDKQINALPDSQLLLLAVADARKAARLPGYVLDMAHWHYPVKYRRKTVCHVCMGGCMLIGRIPRTKYMSGCVDGPAFMRRVDYMRKGNFVSADRVTPQQYTALDAASKLIFDNYNDKLARAPWRTYERAARILAKAGL